MERPSPSEFMQRMEWLGANDMALRTAALRAKARDWQDDVEFAMLCVAAGNLQDAVGPARAAFHAAAHEPYAAYAFGIVSVMSQAWQDAIDAFAGIPEPFDLYAQCRIFLGLALFELGRFEDAERTTHETFVVDDDGYGTICALRGRCAVELGKPLEAATAFDEALLFSPKLTWVRPLRANLPPPAQPAIRTVAV